MNRTALKKFSFFSLQSSKVQFTLLLALMLSLAICVSPRVAEATDNPLFQESEKDKLPVDILVNHEKKNLQVAQVSGREQGKPINQGKGGEKEEIHWKKRKTWRKNFTGRTPMDGMYNEEVPYHTGADYLSKGQLDKAIAEFTGALAKNPKFAEAYIFRGLAYGRKGQYDKAIIDFNKFIEIDSRDSQAYYNRGVAYTKKGQYDHALADFNQTLKLNPQDAQAHYLRGFIYYKKGQPDRAKTEFQTALKLDRDYVEEAKSRGIGELDTYGAVLQGTEPAPNLAPPATAARKAEALHKQQALTLAKSAKYDQALTEINQALKTDSKDAETYNRRGGIYTLQGQYQQAIADFDKAVNLNPSYARAYYNRALAYYYQGKYDQAIADIEKAIQLHPNDAGAYHNRGLAYDQKKDYDKAIDDFNMAIALNPKLADAYFNKAVSCDKAGRADEAREAYAAFMKLAPPGAAAQVEQARKRLEGP